MSEKCPKCGAKLKAQSSVPHSDCYVWECESYQHEYGGEMHERAPCLRRQLTAAQAVIADQSDIIQRAARLLEIAEYDQKEDLLDQQRVFEAAADTKGD